MMNLILAVHHLLQKLSSSWALKKVPFLLGMKLSSWRKYLRLVLSLWNLPKVFIHEFCHIVWKLTGLLVAWFFHVSSWLAEYFVFVFSLRKMRYMCRLVSNFFVCDLLKFRYVGKVEPSPYFCAGRTNQIYG